MAVSHVSIEGEVADDPCIGAACGAFEVVEDLHRPRLRRGRSRPGGEHRRNRVESVVPRSEFAFHAGNKVLHVAVPLPVMYCGTLTVPKRHTFPRSLRAKSRSMWCSARSFSSARSSARKRSVSGRVVPSGRVPQLGMSSQCYPPRGGASPGSRQSPVASQNQGSTCRDSGSVVVGFRRRRVDRRHPAVFPARQHDLKHLALMDRRSCLRNSVHEPFPGQSAVSENLHSAPGSLHLLSGGPQLEIGRGRSIPPACGCDPRLRRRGKPEFELGERRVRVGGHGFEIADELIRDVSDQAANVPPGTPGASYFARIERRASRADPSSPSRVSIAGPGSVGNDDLRIEADERVFREPRGAC